MSKYPDRVYPSLRAFKQEKRQGIWNALAALRADEASCGIAYSPAYEEIVQARRLLEKAVEKQSQKNWGR